MTGVSRTESAVNVRNITLSGLATPSSVANSTPPLCTDVSTVFTALTTSKLSAAAEEFVPGLVSCSVPSVSTGHASVPTTVLSVSESAADADMLLMHVFLVCMCLVLVYLPLLFMLLLHVHLMVSWRLSLSY